MTTYKYRATEAIAHQWAEKNPGVRQAFTLRNLATQARAFDFIESTTNGALTDASINSLRRMKRVIDRNQGAFDGQAVYHLYPTTQEEWDILRSHVRGDRSYEKDEIEVVEVKGDAN